MRKVPWQSESGHKPAATTDPGADGPHRVSVRCSRCGAVSPGSLNYCPSCGEHLWEPCVQCGAPCPVDELKFCGECGADLTSALEALAAATESRLGEAQSLLDAGRHGEAVPLLKELAKQNHPRVAAFAEQAARLIERLLAERARASAIGQEAIGRAHRALARCDYEEAERILSSLPAPSRSEESEDLLSEVRSRQAEAAALEAELREASRAKLRPALFPKVEQLLRLRPGHKLALHIADQLQHIGRRAAQTKLAQFQYQEAQTILRRIPGALRCPETEKLCTVVDELAWLSWDLSTAPVVDDWLRVGAQRMQERVPDDPHIAAIAARLRNHTEQSPAGNGSRVVTWAAPPPQSLFECPVEWVTEFQRIALHPDLDRSGLDQRAGHFFVAAGLALQGIGEAPVQTNLLPRAPAGVREKLDTFLGALRRRPAAAWGIDISDTGLKAVRLVRDAARHTVLVDRHDFIEHRRPLSHAADTMEEDSLIHDTVKSFLVGKNLARVRVCVSVPDRMTVSRQLDLPPAPPSKLDSLVRHEARLELPGALENLAWDYHVVRSSATEANDAPGVRMLAVAAKLAAVERRHKCVTRAGLACHLMQSDGLALHNFFAFQRPTGEPHDGAPRHDECGATAIVDVGADSTNVIVTAPDVLWLRNLGVGGYSATRALIREFNLTYAQAEQLKRNPVPAPSLRDLYQVLAPVFRDLHREIQQSLALFGATCAGRRIDRILAVGGALQLHGLLRYLRTGQ